MYVFSLTISYTTSLVLGPRATSPLGGGDGSMGWKEQAPFSRIIVTAAAIDVPEVLLDQLDVGGIMIVPVGLDERTQELLKITKHEDDIVTEELGEVRFVPLISDEEGV